jgi:Holliday junction resolvase RusA-like endonuclease
MSLLERSSLSFLVQGQATSKGSMSGFALERPDGSVGVRVVDKTKGLHGWTTAIKWSGKLEMRRQRLELFAGPVTLKVLFVFARPKKPKNRDHHVVKPDLDKLLRAVNDALTGIVWVDDNQVVEIAAAKRYVRDDGVGDFVGASITVESLT